MTETRCCVRPVSAHQRAFNLAPVFLVAGVFPLDPIWRILATIAASCALTLARNSGCSGTRSDTAANRVLGFRVGSYLSAGFEPKIWLAGMGFGVASSPSITSVSNSSLKFTSGMYPVESWTDVIVAAIRSAAYYCDLIAGITYLQASERC